MQPNRDILSDNDFPTSCTVSAAKLRDPCVQRAGPQWSVGGCSRYKETHTSNIKARAEAKPRTQSREEDSSVIPFIVLCSISFSCLHTVS